MSLGFEDIRIWEKEFKFRLTSRQTGKKIDFNIKLKKTTDLARPIAPSHALPASGTPPSAPGPTTTVTPPPGPPRGPGTTGGSTDYETPGSEDSPLPPIEVLPPGRPPTSSPGVPPIDAEMFPDDTGTSPGPTPDPSTTIATARPGVPEIRGTLRRDPVTDEVGLRPPPKPPGYG